MLRSASPDDTIVVQEPPSNIADLRSEWELTLPDSCYAMASGALGWDLPAAVGVALAERDMGRNRPVVAVIGDGSLQFSSQALYTAVRQELPLVVIVPNNHERGILKAFATFQKNPGVPGLDLPGPTGARVWRYGPRGLNSSAGALRTRGSVGSTRPHGDRSSDKRGNTTSGVAWSTPRDAGLQTVTLIAAVRN